MLLTSVYTPLGICELCFFQDSDCGATVSTGVSLKIGLSIPWLTKTMLNKVCFVAKTEFYTHNQLTFFVTKVESCTQLGVR